jgi:hypothetical protein
MNLLKQQKTIRRKNYDFLLIAFFFILFIYSFKLLLNQKQGDDDSNINSSIASIARTYNEVKYRRNADFRWKPADLGQHLKIRDRIFTGADSLAEIDVKNVKISIRDNSLLEVGPPREYDFSFEFGYLVLKMQKSPVRILIKGKNYLISPKKSSDLSIKLNGSELEFIGDRESVSITELNGSKEVNITQELFFNNQVCGAKTDVVSIESSRLCPKCDKSTLLIQKNENDRKRLQGQPSIKLARGKNSFSIEDRNEICEITLLPIVAPKLKLETAKLNLNYESGTAEAKLHIEDNDRNLVGKYFKLEITKDENNPQPRFIQFRSETYKLTLSKEGRYYFKIYVCNKEECSESSLVNILEVVRPAILPPPELDNIYRIKKKNEALFRDPSSVDFIEFKPVPGAKSYRFKIFKEGKIFSQGDINNTQVDISELTPGRYRLRIYPVDRWNRKGQFAETSIQIEEPPEEKKTDSFALKYNNRKTQYFIAYSAGLNFFQLIQTGQVGDAKGTVFLPSWLNLSTGLKTDNYELGFEYQQYQIQAESDSNTRKLNVNLEEFQLYAIRKNLRLGAGRSQIPYINVQDDEFTLEKEAATFLDVGYDKRGEWTYLGLRYRKGISTGSSIKNHNAGIGIFEIQRPITKNKLYWYNGIEVVAQFNKLKVNGKSSEQILLREFLKMGIRFEF